MNRRVANALPLGGARELGFGDGLGGFRREAPQSKVAPSAVRSSKVLEFLYFYLDL